MRLPANRRERHDTYRDLLRRCEVSRDDRRERYRRLRLAYLNGSPDGAPVRSNRLARHVRSVTLLEKQIRFRAWWQRVSHDDRPSHQDQQA